MNSWGLDTMTNPATVTLLAPTVALKHKCPLKETMFSWKNAQFQFLGKKYTRWVWNILSCSEQRSYQGPLGSSQEDRGADRKKFHDQHGQFELQQKTNSMHQNRLTLKFMVQKDIKIYWLLSEDDTKPIHYFLNW